jgi:hypothetical protein
MSGSWNTWACPGAARRPFSLRRRALGKSLVLSLPPDGSRSEVYGELPQDRTSRETGLDHFGVTQREIKLKSFAIGTLLLLLSAGMSFAQMAPVAPMAPAMGATTPLGMPGAIPSSVGPVGVPLGATELSPGGLSPMALDPTTSTNSCTSAGMSGAGMLGAGTSSMTNSYSTFDGAGMSTSPVGMSASSSCGAGGTASGTTIAPSALSGSTAGQAPGLAPVGSIPLGSTELGNAGVSPMVTSPALPSPCTMSLGGSTPMASTNGTTSAVGSSC